MDQVVWVDVEDSGTSPGRRPALNRKGTKSANTAGTHADAEHVLTAEDAVDEAEKIFNQKHHEHFPAKQEVQGRLARCLRSPSFESALSVVICLNMILIIAETDLTADGQLPPLWITTSNLTFLAIYVVECLLKILVFRRAFFEDTWNWLDLLVVITDTCLSVLNFFDGVERISVMRIFRLIKLSRAIRVIRQIWELKILLLGFKAAAKSIFFGMGMVLVMTVVWAILGVQLIHPVNSEVWADSDCEQCKRAFGSVWNACLTIFQTVVAGDSWGMLALPIIDQAPWTAVWFLIVLVTVQLAMLNLILAVIVERAADAREKEVTREVLQQEETMHKSKLKLIQLCRNLDTDGNGRLSEDEFLAGFEENSEFAAALLGMGVYPEDIGLLFNVLDTRGSGEVTYVSFVNTLARLRTQMSQVILFSITELRKAVTQIQDQVAPPAIPSGPDALRRQLEASNKEMQLKFQKMQFEIAQSYQNALKLALDSMTKAPQMETLQQMSKDLDAMSQEAAKATEQLTAYPSNLFRNTPEAPQNVNEVTTVRTRGSTCCGAEPVSQPGSDIPGGGRSLIQSADQASDPRWI